MHKCMQACIGFYVNTYILTYIHTCIRVRRDTHMHSYCLYFVLYLTTCKVPRIVQTIQRRSLCDEGKDKILGSGWMQRDD